MDFVYHVLNEKFYIHIKAIDLLFADVCDTSEAAHLEQKLRSLGCELVTLRSRLPSSAGVPPPISSATGLSGQGNNHTLATHKQTASHTLANQNTPVGLSKINQSNCPNNNLISNNNNLHSNNSGAVLDSNLRHSQQGSTGQQQQSTVGKILPSSTLDGRATLPKSNGSGDPFMERAAPTDNNFASFPFDLATDNNKSNCYKGFGSSDALHNIKNKTPFSALSPPPHRPQIQPRILQHPFHQQEQQQKQQQQQQQQQFHTKGGRSDSAKIQQQEHLKSLQERQAPLPKDAAQTPPSNKEVSSEGESYSFKRNKCSVFCQRPFLFLVVGYSAPAFYMCFYKNRTCII